MKLANIKRHQPGPVQFLLGADAYDDLFLKEKKDHGLHCHKYIFGCVVTGVLSHVRGFEYQSQVANIPSCSGTGPCSVLGSRRDSSSEADVKKIVSAWNDTTQRPMLQMTAASLFVSPSSLRLVPRTIFKRPSRENSHCKEIQESQ